MMIPIVPTLAERLRYWAQNEEMIDNSMLEHGEDCEKAADHIESLERRLIAATKPGYAKDAERYRWLRDTNRTIVLRTASGKVYSERRYDTGSGDGLDRAIDAEIVANG